MDLTEYRQKLIGNEDERAVSPVIGVILMVAITVILAAVVAAFILDLGGSMGEEAQAGASIDVDENDREIQSSWTSQGNSDSVNVTVSYTAYEDSGEGEEDGEVSVVLNNVGESEAWDWNDLTDDADDEPLEDNWSDGGGVERVDGTITATATIDGGSSTVVADTSFEFEQSSDD